MHISARMMRNPNLREALADCKILLNGEPRSNCLVADTEQRYIIRQIKTGKFNNILIETGKVEVLFKVKK